MYGDDELDEVVGGGRLESTGDAAQSECPVVCGWVWRMLGHVAAIVCSVFSFPLCNMKHISYMLTPCVLCALSTCAGEARKSAAAARSRKSQAHRESNMFRSRKSLTGGCWFCWVSCHGPTWSALMHAYRHGHVLKAWRVLHIQVACCIGRPVCCPSCQHLVCCNCAHPVTSSTATTADTAR